MVIKKARGNWVSMYDYSLLDRHNYHWLFVCIQCIKLKISNSVN